MTLTERAKEVAKICSDFRKSDKCYYVESPVGEYLTDADQFADRSMLLVTRCSECNAEIDEWSLDTPDNNPICENCY